MIAPVLTRAMQVKHPAELWPLSRPGLWLAIPLVVIAYASVAAISLALAIPPGYASAVWPPAGIALAAALAFGLRIWPGVLLGAALANLGVMGTPVPVAIAIGAGNAAEAVAAAWLIQRLIGLRHRFERPAAVWSFAAVAFASALIAATNGVGTLLLMGQIPWQEFFRHWVTWWLGDATGMIIVAPLLLCWSEPAGEQAPGGPRAEAHLFAVLLLLSGVLAWTVRWPSDTVQTLAYLMIPLVVWAAARLDQRAVTAASFTISAIAVLDMLDGAASMFMSVSRNESLLLLQLFVSAVALTGLTLSALVGEVARVNARLEAAQEALAQRMVGIRDEERTRLLADLHDGAAQDVTSLAVALDLMRVERTRRDASWLDERLAEAQGIARRAARSLRELIGGLRLPGLEGLALRSALRRHAAEFESRTGILVEVIAPPGPDLLPVKVKEALLRICLEALANVAKHADADRVRIVLATRAPGVCLGVEDNGRGFAQQDDPAPPGAGLLIMRERALAIGADFGLHSTPGAGTRIECRLSIGR